MKKKSVKSGVILIICTLLIAMFSYCGLFGVDLGDYRIKTFGSNIDKGLDLVGGTSLLMEIKEDKVDSDVVSRTMELIKMRIDPEGVKEVQVTQEGEKRIKIEIPGEFDTEGVIETVAKTGELTFVDPNEETILTGKDVKEAGAYMNSDGQYQVSLELNESGKEAFAKATTEFQGQQIAIKMDGEILTNPKVNEPILDGKASISGMESLEEANKIAGIINSGALPVKVESISAKTVGPTIGAESLQLSKKASIIGVAVVVLFMTAFYRRPGFVASISLALYCCIILTIFAETGVVLSLAGIAALLLTIGMAVDANVLIFERTKEELKNGRSILTAVEAGYQGALSSILDSNLTTIIAALVLYFLGSGVVKGFATTLFIGIIVSIITALFVTKFLMNCAVKAGFITKASHFGIKGGKSNE